MESLRKQKRELHIRRLSYLLARHNAPRTEMTFIVLLTGAVGFLTSVLLLRVGLHTMWLRYALSIVMAYMGFLLLVRVWLAMHQSLLPGGDEEQINPSDFSRMLAEGIQPSPFDAPSHEAPSMVEIGLDELVVYLALLVAAFSLMVSSAYVIWIAPDLLAEVLLDSVLSVGLYRRLRDIDRQHWSVSVFRRTILPAMIVLLTFIIAGAVLQAYAPYADSLGQVWVRLKSGHH